MKSHAKMTKIVPSHIVKKLRHAVGNAALPDRLKADVAKAKDFVFDALKKKKTRAYGGITVLNYYKSLLHLPHSLTKIKKAYRVSSSADHAATSSDDRQLIIPNYDACCSACDDPVNPAVSSFILKRINEEAPNLDQEIDRLADDFIATFHENFRLEKQRSFRQYQEMLARST